jgi:hypothetical protein
LTGGDALKAEELQDLTQHLIDAHGKIEGHLRWRPRRAAKDLCQEFRILLERGDFWNQFETTAKQVQRFEKEADNMLGNIKTLIADETEILARLGADQSQIGSILSSVYDAIDIAAARNADITSQGIRNLWDRLASATDLICRTSRGPILQTLDFVVSKKGALTIAALGLGGANIWFAVTADGGALSHVSMKVAVAAAHGHLGGILGLLGGG